MSKTYLLALLVVCEIFTISLARAPEVGQAIVVRAKRQECRCVRLTFGSGMQCSCPKPHAASPSDLTHEENEQKDELATELSSSAFPQARCACIQIVFKGNPQYQCQCGESGTVAPVVTTTNAPRTTTETTTFTTTEIPTTTTPAPTPAPEFTTAPSVFTTPAYVTGVPTGQPQNGQCQCIMIHISGPASAHYQCSCQSTTTQAPIGWNPTSIPDTLPTEAPPAPETLPPITAHEVPETYPTYPPIVFPDTTEAPIITLPPATEPPTTTAPPAPPLPETVAPVYPLTTTCVMYLTGVQSTPCMCMPEYDQCAQNICCLKAKFRSLKHSTGSSSLALQNDSPSPVYQEPSTIDMLMNVLQKIKTKFE